MASLEHDAIVVKDDGAQELVRNDVFIAHDGYRRTPCRGVDASRLLLIHFNEDRSATGGPAKRRQKTMSKAYIIEFDEIAAGIIAPDGQGFRFHHADRSFTALEGRSFSSYQQAERAARALLARLRGHKTHDAVFAGRRKATPGPFQTSSRHAPPG